MNLRRTPILACAVLTVTLVAGCQSISNGVTYASDWTPNFLKPFRPDIHQGNIITKEMAEQLRPGMSREQVRFMLGTPLLRDEFHKDRWDYVYYLNRRSGEVQNRKLTVYFKDNKLERYTADPLPDETMADALILGSDVAKRNKPAPAQVQPPPEIATPSPTRD